MHHRPSKKPLARKKKVKIHRSSTDTSVSPMDSLFFPLFPPLAIHHSQSSPPITAASPLFSRIWVGSVAGDRPKTKQRWFPGDINDKRNKDSKQKTAKKKNQPIIPITSFCWTWVKSLQKLPTTCCNKPETPQQLAHQEAKKPATQRVTYPSSPFQTKMVKILLTGINITFGS